MLSRPYDQIAADLGLEAYVEDCSDGSNPEAGRLQPWSKSFLLPLFLIQLYWNSATPFNLLMMYGFFHTTITELSMAQEVKNIYHSSSQGYGFSSSHVWM